MSPPVQRTTGFLVPGTDFGGVKAFDDHRNEALAREMPKTEIHAVFDRLAS